MVVTISDGGGTIVTRIRVCEGDISIDGPLPGGLTVADLRNLGFVYYETDQRGELAARLCEVPVENSLNYLRALNDALPPGFHLAAVDSATIEEQRRCKRQAFEEELERIDQDG